MAKYQLMQFKPSGKWYQSFELEMETCCEPGYACKEPIETALKAQHNNPMSEKWSWVMPETPWGYPIMFPVKEEA